MGYFEDVPQANLLAWYGKTKRNLIQKACTHHSPVKRNIGYYTTQIKHRKTKGRFSRLLRHPAWKRRGPILVSALHKSGTYLLRHLPTYLQPRTHTGPLLRELRWTSPPHFRQGPCVTEIDEKKLKRTINTTHSAPKHNTKRKFLKKFWGEAQPMASPSRERRSSSPCLSICSPLPCLDLATHLDACTHGDARCVFRDAPLIVIIYLSTKRNTL